MFEVWGRRHWDYLTEGERWCPTTNGIGVQALAHWLARRSPDCSSPYHLFWLTATETDPTPLEGLDDS
jgi:hypothetical protein